MPKHIHPVQRISASDSLFSGTVRITGGPNITVGTDASGVSISGAAGGGGGAFTGGMSNIGNTAGTTGTVQSQMLVVGGPNMTASQSINGNSATVSLSGAEAIRAIVASNTTYSSGTVSITGARGIEISTSANQNVIVQEPYDSVWRAYAHQPATFQALTHGSIYIGHCDLPRPLTASCAHIPLTISTQSASTAALSLSFGMYTRSNATRIASVASGSQSYSWTTGTNNSTNWGGYNFERVFTIPITIDATPGNYWYAVGVRTANAGSYSWLVEVQSPGRLDFAGSNTILSASCDPFAGAYSTTSAALPASMATAEITVNGNPVARRHVIITNL